MDHDAFELLYQTHYRAVNSYLLTLTHSEAEADDLTQEAFLNYYRSATKFRGECSELTMLCKIGKNLFLNRLRKEKRLTPLPEDSEESGISLEEQMSDANDAMHIHEILHRLPEPYKEVFSLHLFGELPFSKIAALFGKSESWAKMTFYRAKSKIVAALKEES